MSKVNKRTLADIFGISERTFTEYQKDSSFPFAVTGRGSSNEYDTVEVFNWLVERATAGASRESAQDALARIKAEREKLGHAKDLKEVVLTEELKPGLVRLAMAIRTELLTGNPRLKAEIDTLYGIDTDIELLNEHSCAILRNLSDLGREPESVNSGSIESLSAPKKDIQR